MNYRQRPRVSEEIRSLTRAIGVQARPTAPQLARLEQVRGEAAEAIAALHRVIDGTVRPLNERLGSYPRILMGGGDRPTVSTGGR